MPTNRLCFKPGTSTSPSSPAFTCPMISTIHLVQSTDGENLEIAGEDIALATSADERDCFPISSLTPEVSDVQVPGLKHNSEVLPRTRTKNQNY